MLAFLHTAEVHAASFEALVRELAPGMPTRHVVRPDLLADARRMGVDDAALCARVHAAMRDAAAHGARVVCCTCSTIGGIAESTPGDSPRAFMARRIDRAMADAAVRHGPRVLVVAALQSTLPPTLALVHSAGAAAGVAVEPTALCVPEAWPHFEAGDTPRYLQALAQAIRPAAAHADVVVLAQASMAAVAALLEDIGVPVLASPRPGVAQALNDLRHVSP